MKKITILTIIFAILLTGCGTNKEALKFKKDYEKLNGTIREKDGKENRTVSISKKNPFVYSSPKEIIKKIKNKETFYVYFGSSSCPWCRSAIEKAIEVANKNKIKKIYYVDIWDSEGKEILRSKKSLKDGEIVTEIEGTKEYYKLLEYFDDLLEDYTLMDEEGEKIEVGEKRLFAPNYIYIKNGKAKKLVQGTSINQTDSRQKLTKELLKDEEEIFSDFFKNK